MIAMSQKLSSMNKLSQGSNIQVIEKDREWQDKFQKMKTDFES